MWVNRLSHPLCQQHIHIGYPQPITPPFAAAAGHNHLMRRALTDPMLLPSCLLHILNRPILWPEPTWWQKMISSALALWRPRNKRIKIFNFEFIPHNLVFQRNVRYKLEIKYFYSRYTIFFSLRIGSLYSSILTVFPSEL